MNTEKLAFVLEKGNVPRTFILHFNKDINSLLSRLAITFEVAPKLPNIEGMGQGLIPLQIPIPHDEYKPVQRLVGIENILPVSRYVILIQIGRAFRFRDVMASLENALEMDMSHTEQTKWETNIIDSYPDSFHPHMGMEKTIGNEDEEEEDYTDNNGGPTLVRMSMSDTDNPFDLIRKIIQSKGSIEPAKKKRKPAKKRTIRKKKDE